MIRRCDERDFELIWAIINDGAQAYKGIIPADRWTEPYMSREKLQHEIDEGVVFWGYEENTTPSSISCCNFSRSEEHTSELQSRGHLVCRLLLEKKKKKKKTNEIKK